MAMEEPQKPIAIEEASNPNPNPNNGNDDVEEGEILGEEDSSATESKNLNHVSHPLEHKWTFWSYNPSAKSKQATWGSSMRPIYTFSTVEEFWSIYNNIPRPSKLAVGADVHCFKYTIEPKWEDPVCANGGKWTVTLSKGKSDTSWLYTLLALIGEQFDYGDEICGVVVSVRVRLERIALWTRNASNEAAQLSIGKQWKELIDYNDTIGFIVHEDAKKLERSAKNRYST